MRVLAIRGRNLASLEGDFAIDFEAEPLASAGIFAITGPTGAGKSTLLDAMCLALFNRLPRLTGATGGQVGPDGGEAISVTDTRAVLRHRSGEGFAEVDFVGRDRVRYRARWTVKRARGRADGTLQNVVQELTDLDTGDRIGSTRTETLEAIRERVGLTADQFARTVMLAQGEFDAFVRADANDRAALLEKLTGTGIYAQLGMAAKRKAETLRAELAVIEQRMADQRGLDDVARSEAETKLTNARVALVAAGEVLEGLERGRQWHEVAATLATRVAEAQAALDVGRAAHVAAAPRRETLRQRLSAATFVAEWKVVEEAKEKAARTVEQKVAFERALALASAEHERCEAAETQAAAALRMAEAALAEARPVLERARSLDRDLDAVAAQLTPLEAACIAETAALQQAEAAWVQAQAGHRDGAARCADLANWVTMHDGRRLLAFREGPLRASLDEHAALVARQARLAEQARAAATEVARHTEARTAADEALANASKAYTSAQAELERAQVGAPSAEELEAATRRRDAIAAVEPKLAAVERCVDRVSSLEAEAARLEDKRSREVETLARHREQGAGIEAVLPVLCGQLEEARRSSALSAAAAEDAAGRLRETLISGEPCPVCGSRDHVLDAAAALTEERADADRERLATLEAEERGREREVAAIGGWIQGGERQVAALQGERERIATAVGSAREEAGKAQGVLLAAAAIVNLPIDADLPAARAGIARRLAAADESRAALDGARRKLERVRNEAEGLRVAREAAETTRSREVDAELSALAHEAVLTREVHDLTAQQARVGAELNRDLMPYFDWTQARDGREQLEQLVIEWRAGERDLGEANAALPGLAQSVHAADLARTTARSAYDQTNANVAALKQRRQRLAPERAALFGGEATAAISERLEGAVRAGTAACEAARDAARASRGAFSAAEARLETGREAQTADEAMAVGRAAQLTARLTPLNLTVDAIAAEAMVGAGALEAEQEAFRKIDEGVTRAAAEQEARARDHVAHLANAAPDLAPDELAEAIAAVESLLIRVREAEGEAALVIRQDDAARAATLTLRAEHANRQAAAQVWLQLDQLIGDTSGNKFRRFVQGLTLDRLLLHANVRLTELKPRYELQRGAAGEMVVQVVDHDMAGEVRGLHNLSGGERFMISLALALGLSEMSGTAGMRIESLFIDEGFGSLDSASLGSAIAMLEQLHATGRRVGVISHIEEVKERIPVKIAVTPIARGRSTLEVLAD